MKAKEFKHQNVIIAKDQPPYLPLPALKITVPHLEIGDPEGHVIFCMHLSFKERVRVLFTGEIWCSLMTFGRLTPSFHSTKRTDCFIHPDDEKSKLKDFFNYGAIIYYSKIINNK